MMHSLPLTSTKKQKDRSMIAIVMAIMLHILIAGIVYFTVFNKKPSSTLEPISAADRYPGLTTTETKQQTSPALTESTDLKSQTTQPSAPKSNNDVTNSHKVTTDIQSKSAPITADAGTTQTPISTNNAQNLGQEEKSVVDSTVEAFTVSIPDHQNNRAEYKLDQTKEYATLDADIDKDNEQLSKLITEVKKRNQSQIQQHQLPNNNINNQPTVEYDYPITPITSLPAENKSSAVE